MRGEDIVIDEETTYDPHDPKAVAEFWKDAKVAFLILKMNSDID